jgi:hypothetical protein
MLNKQIKQEFIKFLKDNNAYYEYVTNLASCPSAYIKESTSWISPRKATLSLICKKRNVSKFIEDAFNWGDAKKRTFYWLGLSIKWGLHCKKHNIKR